MMSGFAQHRNSDGSRPVHLVPVGELSPAALREAEEQQAWSRELDGVGRAAFSAAGSAPLPSPVELGCDVTGLSPERAALACLLALLEQLQGEAAKLGVELDVVRSRPMPAATDGSREQLERMDLDEREALGLWMRSGCEGPRPELRTAQREALEQDIRMAEWEAGVQRETIRKVEVDLVTRKAWIKALEAKKPDLVSAVLQESAEPIQREIDGLMRGEVAELDRQIISLYERMDAIGRKIADKQRCLGGQARATGRQNHPAVSVSLPHRPVVMVKAEECGAAEEAWHGFAEKLAHDPRAENDPLTE